MSVVCRTAVYSLRYENVGVFHFEETTSSLQSPSDLNNITIWYEANGSQDLYQSWNGISFRHNHKSPFQRTVAREIWNHLVSVGFSSHLESSRVLIVDEQSSP